jgi:hypothetical protein
LGIVSMGVVLLLALFVFVAATTISNGALISRGRAHRPQLGAALMTLVPVLSQSTLAYSAEQIISWKEEVLLSSGQRLIVERSKTKNPRGFREPGQGAPLAEEALWFRSGSPEREIIWRSKFGRGFEDNLTLLLLDFMDGAPYIATYPASCLAYNRWERPNPPYVFFKFNGTTWQRIPISEFPATFTRANVLRGGYNRSQLTAKERSEPVVKAETVSRLNDLGGDTGFLVDIGREPITYGPGNPASCPIMVYQGKGVWRSPDGPKAPNRIPSPATPSSKN